MTIAWNTIISLNNSQNNAFEELVCQLARDEFIEGRRDFYRIAAPDGGVEAYCVLNNGDEYARQALLIPDSRLPVVLSRNKGKGPIRHAGQGYRNRTD
jgi:hypothetical protein